MPSFKHRSNQKELLDRDDIPFAHIKKNMEELELINRRLGGHKITVNGVAEILNGYPLHHIPLRVIEIGCGGGDNLRAIKKWTENLQLPVRLTGVDVNPECIEYAKQQSGNKGIEFVHSDYRDMAFSQLPDLVFSSLFCHHFPDEELVRMLKWMQKNSALGFFINDLHRHPIAYYSIRMLTMSLSESYLVKNDAPLSVLRGFKRSDWIRLFSEAGISFQCKWKWAFRWLLISCKKWN